MKLYVGIVLGLLAIAASAKALLCWDFPILRRMLGVNDDHSCKSGSGGGGNSGSGNGGSGYGFYGYPSGGYPYSLYPGAVLPYSASGPVPISYPVPSPVPGVIYSASAPGPVVQVQSASKPITFAATSEPVVSLGGIFPSGY